MSSVVLVFNREPGPQEGVTQSPSTSKHNIIDHKPGATRNQEPGTHMNHDQEKRTGTSDK